MPKGYAIADTKKWTDFKVIDFDLKTPEDDDVDVDIQFCGVCGSDVHTISGGWGELSVPAVIPGHEIVGKVTKVGKNVKGIEVGQRVGVGAQVGSCGTCNPCKTDHENYCIGDGKKGLVDTYNSLYPDGKAAQGGYSTAIRAHQQFVFPIPDAITSEDAASMLCGGLTVFAPLNRNGCGPGKKVAVVGLGGLGHYAVLFAVAMGAEVTVISHSPKKKEDAFKMGAKHFVATGEDKDWHTRYGRELTPFDIIISTASSNAVDLKSVMHTLQTYGSCVYVGMPEDHFEVRAQTLAFNGCNLQGSHIGSKKEALKMLDLAAEKNVKPWIEVLDMKECAKAVARVHSNDIRYRFVLKQDLEPVA
ncbi:GroES-like protein [Acaromyces ingoldii]|uniref:alcohol dehydrogenase (NADP(+)) n=1 Tax=Acaromyces ingoldii TaxID=215250 RepID=A0A316YNR8_9BASI|nr:GroES-like protein [Acaromyces ingoldii]PWN91190.1 GroES-like protein [Acaromyces ingoldii]